jgi:hypothetical protein
MPSAATADRAFFATANWLSVALGSMQLPTERGVLLENANRSRCRRVRDGI